MRVWDSILTDTDRGVIERGGYGKSRGLGKSPCLMIIDMQQQLVGDDLPILEQQARWPAGGGQMAWASARNIARLVEVARRLQIPTVYSRNFRRQDLLAGGSRGGKVGRTDPTGADDPATQIIELLAPQEGDLVLAKSFPSVFFATPLLSYLNGRRVDTLLITGNSTSGCVRATCVDAVSLNFRVGVIEDAVSDRIVASHQASLLDIWMKYADVLPTAEALRYLEGIEPGS